MRYKRELQEYITIAEEAAIYERCGLFKKAADLWSKAQAVARIDKNKHWANARSDFCYRNVVRPFDKE